MNGLVDFGVVLAAVVAALPYIALVAMFLVVVLVSVVKYKLTARDIATKAIALALDSLNSVIDNLSMDDLDLAVAAVYEKAPSVVFGAIPFKRLFTLAKAQELARVLFQAAHDYAHSKDGDVLRKSLKDARSLRVQRRL